MDKVTTWLWCDGTAEDMAAFYTGLIPDSRIVETVRAPLDTPGGARAGDVLMVEFTLGGRIFAALNGGPGVAPSIALSLQVVCEDQAEVDRYWNALSAMPKPNSAAGSGTASAWPGRSCLDQCSSHPTARAPEGPWKR